jgi:hypothetical protein
MHNNLEKIMNFSNIKQLNFLIANVHLLLTKACKWF